MQVRGQIGRVGRRRRVLRCAGRVALLVTCTLITATVAGAHNPLTRPIGRIQGADVSVDGGTAARVANAGAPPSINVFNGSAVTVHSGKARVTLSTGGAIDVCGPAKFTLLASGGDITLALNFGRLHVDLPAKVSLRIFTPAIIATPIDINGGSRDLTVGLDLNDSLCVLATSGAIQLEHQFSGEKLVVPQAGHFVLNGGTLVPVSDREGSCGCTPMAEHPAPQGPATIPEFARAAMARPEPSPQVPPPPGPTRAAEARANRLAAQRRVQPGAVLLIPVHPNDSHPLPPPGQPSAGEAPAIGNTLGGNITPALAFMASSPSARAQPDAEMMLLVSEARESPDWRFEGQVDAPPFVQEMRHALGEEPTTRAPALGAHTDRQTKKPGLWAALKELFLGKLEAHDSPPAGVH